MKPKRRRKQLVKQVISCLMIIAMLAPNTVPLLAYGADWLGNRPRYVDFTRPSALTLNDLGLASDSDANPIIMPDKKTQETVETTQTTATDSNAVMREPEDYYEIEIDEPDGELVEFTNGYRTYQIADGTYTTIFGGYSGYYADEDGTVWPIDNTLSPDGWADGDSTADDEVTEENSEDITLFNDLIMGTSGKRIQFGSGISYGKATASNATPSNATGKRNVPSYENRSGAMKVSIPKAMSRTEGIQVTLDESVMEFIPSEGDFTRSRVRDNAIRYSDVFEGIDFQYTVIGNTVKEDIILLDQTDRNSFSFKLKIPGLKAVQRKNTIEIRRQGKSSPLLVLEAPSMTDADGGRSLELELELSEVNGDYIATVTADRAWLDAEDRAYPVRIDPAPMIPAEEFYMITVAEGQPDKYLGWDHVPTVGYVDDNYKNCRVYLLFNNQNDQHMQDIMASATECLEATLSVTAMTNNSDHETVIQLGFPDGPWPYQRPSWNTKPPIKKGENGEDWLLSANAPGIDQKIVYDITTYLNDCIMGRSVQAGFMLRAQIEAKSTGGTAPFRQVAENFYNRDSEAYGPRIDITWSGDLPDAPELAKLTVDQTTIGVDPAPAKSEIGGRTVSGVVAHGLAQAGADVYYTIKEVENGGEEPEENTTAADTIQYIDFAAAGLDSAKAPIKKSNWQTAGLEPEQPLKFDTIYEIDAHAVGLPMDEEGEPDEEAEPVTGKTVTSERFLLYRVQQHDLVKRIARHYEVNPDQIARDNQLYDGQLTEAGTVIFIRNPGKSEPYTPEPLREQDLMLLVSLLLGLNPNCILGLEPINMNTGNFFMQHVDADLEELDGTFRIERSYNSLDTDYRSTFGMGWTSPLEQHLSILGDGRVLFKRGDGAGMAFTKDGDIYKAPDGYDSILETLDSIDIVTDDTEEEETDGDGAEADGTSEQTGTARDNSASEAGDPAALTSLLSDLSTEYEEETNTDGDNASGEGEEGEGSATPMPQVAGWKLTELDGTVRVFDSLGFIQYTENRKGNRTTYVYNKDYELKRVETPTGKVFDITMDEEYRITEISLPNGGTVSYEYDEDRNLTSVTDPEGGVRRYEYDDQHRMTAWYDENGSRVVENLYDDEGRVVEQTDANGNTAYLEYHGDFTRMTDNRGNSTEYIYDDQKRTTAIRYPDGTEEHRTYGEDGYVASVTDEAGNTTAYTYDEAGNILSERRADGATAKYTYNSQNRMTSVKDYEDNIGTFTYDELGNLLISTDGEGNITRYSYDDESRLISITDANGGKRQYEYDGAVVTAYTDGEGNTWTFTYDEMNRMLTSTDPLGNVESFGYNLREWGISETNGEGATTVYEYDAAGCVKSIIDAKGNATEFAYDKAYNLIESVDALGNTYSYSYDGNHNRSTETDANGNTTSYEYDPRDRMVKTTDALGNEISYILDGKGNIIETADRRGNTVTAEYDTVLGLPVKVVDALGNVTTYSYDRNGRLIEVGYPDGTSISNEYDKAGRMVGTTAQNGLETRITYDGNGNITRIMDDETRVYQYVYDGNNQLVKATDPLGFTITYLYDRAGNQTGMRDARNNATGYSYDAAGRLQEIKNALDGTITIAYDILGNPLTVTDANGNTDEFHYNAIMQIQAQVDAAGNVTATEHDPLGNVIKVTDALKGETAYEVDPLNRTVKMTDALGGEYEYTYDENGNLLKIIMPDGDTVNMSYDANNQMTHYRDEASVITRYEYDSMGRITSATDTAGNTMDYEYDERGNLVRQTDTIGRDAVYEYDKFGRLVSVTGTDLATTTYTYDALDRLTSVTQADGALTVYEYDEVGNLIKTTEPGEAVYTYAYDAINRLTGKVNPLGASTTFQYDAMDNLISSTDGEGNTRDYTYDVLDRLISVTDGNGGITGYEYDELSRLLAQTTPEGNRAEYRYDALGRMTKAKDPNGLITEYNYDVMGNLVEAISPKGARTAYTYDKHDELTSVTDPDGNVTCYEVDLNRRVTEMTQKNGGKYRYAYDAVHRLTGICTPLGLERTFTYDMADNVVKDTDNLGRTTTYEYDIMHRMTKSTNSLGGVTEYGYDIRGNQSGMTDAMGHTWNYRYDLIDQLRVSVDPEGKATEATYDLVGNITSITAPGERTTSYTYDRNYNMTSMTDPKGYVYQRVYDRDNRMVGTVDPLEQMEAITYDAGSRLTAVQDKMGLMQYFTYDAHGNVITSKATNGLVTQFQYDILDNLVRVTDPMGYQTTYQYDVMGNIISMTNARLKTTGYAYDLEGNMTSLTSPMGRVEQYSYDVAGRLTERITPSGNRIFYDYDTLNSLADKSYSSANELGNDHPVRMGYNAMGQRISMEDITGEGGYTYDSLGRLKSATNGSGKMVEYFYDEADNLSGILYPDGYSVLYEYDKNDNITKLTDRDGRETTYGYDPLNRLTEVARPDGSRSIYTYNARNQVLEAKNTCICGALISSYQYTYDDGGLIIKEVAKENLFTSEKDYGHIGGASDRCMHKTDNPWMNQNPEWETTVRDFTYDDNGQMTGCKESKGQFDKATYTYAYDEAGNRTLAKKAKLYSYLESWQNTYTYNDDNQMVAATVCEGNLTKKYTFTYDANGNLTAECFRNRAEVTYQYDTENRLTAVYDQQKLLMASTYDGDGNRAFQLNYNPEAECGYGIGWGDDIYMPEHSQNEDGSLTAEGLLFSYLCSNTGRAYDLTEYVNDTNRQYTEVLTAYTVNSGATESYSYAGRMRNSRNDIWTEARGVVRNETSYYLYDGRGSVTANTWYNGRVTDVYQYDPYGQVTLGNTEHTDFYGYNAERYNPNTGLEYLRARYYNVKQGRFFQEDTYLGEITDPLTLNRYAYVKNSPMNYVDPSGEDAIIINRTMATGDSLEDLGVEHMGALIESEEGTWYYFFWGEKGVDYVHVVGFSADGKDYRGFADIDEINAHFMGNRFGTSHSFDASVYIKGDFSEVHKELMEYINKLYGEYHCTSHEEYSARQKMECYACREVFAKAMIYTWWGKNCSQVTMEYIYRGVLHEFEDGTTYTVGDYIDDYFSLDMGINIIPNSNMSNMQHAFGNSATNSRDYEEETKDKLIESVIQSLQGF